MSELTPLLPTALVCAAAIISPGPNFVAVSHRAVSAGRWPAVILALGVAAISSAWAASDA